MCTERRNIGISRCKRSLCAGGAIRVQTRRHIRGGVPKFSAGRVQFPRGNVLPADQIFQSAPADLSPRHEHQDWQINIPRSKKIPKGLCPRASPRSDNDRRRQNILRSRKPDNTTPRRRAKNFPRRELRNCRSAIFFAGTSPNSKSISFVNISVKFRDCHFVLPVNITAGKIHRGIRADNAKL